jgi:DNA-binding response OmpR family regulator
MLSLQLDRPADAIAHGGVELCPGEYQVFVGLRRLPLTGREFQVLAVLVARGGHVVTEQQLHDAVWGSAHHTGPRDRSVDVYVNRLRRKLHGFEPRERLIHTQYATGCRFDPEPTA